MIEYAQAFALFALLAFAFFAERTMRSRIEELPSQTEAITDKITGMTEVLDDIADLLNEAMDAVGNSAIAQTPSSPMEAILSGLISSITAPKNHGPTTQERTIHEIDPTPNESQTENESN
jgi:hypothetical protein